MTVTECTPEARVTRSLLGYGILAGPVYVAVAVVQALTRDGFDLTKHAWSLLANGDHGWVQIGNFVVTGLMTVAAAVGLRRALAGGTGHRWAPLLLGAYGVSLVAAGAFRADPALGFPVGAPETPAVSWHGTLHFVAGGLGFACLVAACFVLARRFSHDGRRRLATFSVVTGTVFLAAFAGIASGSHGPTTLVFVAAVVLVSAWTTVVSVHFYRAAA